MNWRLLPYTIDTPAKNMAIDEAIFNCYLGGSAPPTLRFYGWTLPTLSIGYFQDPTREINIENLVAKGFGLVRRPTGGQAVLHQHELTYSIIAGVKDGLPDHLLESYYYISQALITAFGQFGITAELHREKAAKDFSSGACFERPSRYELKVANRKLVGSAQLRRNGSFLQHGSILLDFSAADLGAVLQLPPGITLNRFLERLNQKVISFRDLGVIIAPAFLADAVIDGFRMLYHLEFAENPLSEVEEQLVQELIRIKYDNRDWNYTRGRTKNQGVVINI